MMMTYTLGRLVDRHRFVAPLVIPPILALLGLSAVAGFLRSGGPTMIPIAVGALYWAWHTFARAPRSLEIHVGGLVVSRGLHREAVPWHEIERVIFGRPGGARHGVHVVLRGGEQLSVLSGNVGKAKARAIAETLVFATGADRAQEGL
jgi:hypothetical protein